MMNEYRSRTDGCEFHAKKNNPIFAPLAKIHANGTSFFRYKIYLALVFLFLFLTSLQAKDKERDYYTVTQVIDGNTVVLDNKQTIQLIGIKCPSPDDSKEIIKKWGLKAKDFTERMLLNNKVWLEGQKDYKEKSWAFVFFVMNLEKMSGVVDKGFMPFWGTSGKFMASRILVEQGYCSTASPFSFKYRSTFMELEKTARQRQYGMWQDFAQ